MNSGAQNQRSNPTAYGYGTTNNDPRMGQSNGSMQNTRQDMGVNRSAGNIGSHTSQTPVAAGLSLRSPYEVGQPVNNMRRAENTFSENNAQTQLRNMQAQNPHSQSHSGFAGGQTSHMNTNVSNHVTTNSLNRPALSNVGTSSVQDFEGRNIDSRTRNQALSSKNEFEELTQWTLELSRQADSTNKESRVDTTTDELDTELSGLNVSSLIADENENEKALRLARELADITPDESDFETPAFLRRKDDSQSRVL
jgi:hypothetical protein